MKLVAQVEVCPVQFLSPEGCYMHLTFSLSYIEVIVYPGRRNHHQGKQNALAQQQPSTPESKKPVHVRIWTYLFVINP